MIPGQGYPKGPTVKKDDPWCLRYGRLVLLLISTFPSIAIGCEAQTHLSKFSDEILELFFMFVLYHQDSETFIKDSGTFIKAS